MLLLSTIILAVINVALLILVILRETNETIANRINNIIYSIDDFLANIFNKEVLR